MSSKAYMQGRSSFLLGGTRPQAMLWSDNPGTLQDSYYFPTGTEGEDFIIVSDHNRSTIQFSQERIEKRERTVNGSMRSYWISDKLKISTSWNRLPSRPFDDSVSFNQSTGQIETSNYLSYTVDGSAGGVDLLKWYEDHPGPFYLFLSYDKYKKNSSNYSQLFTYSQIIKVYFSSFSYSVEKRSGIANNNGFDFWDIDVELEEA